MNPKLHKRIRLTALLIILTLIPSNMGLATSDSRAEVMALSSGALFQNGADRLADLQNDDGGWGWPLAGPSHPNTVGPIAKGLAEAYGFTSDPDHLAALQAAGAFLLAKRNNFYPSDGYLATALDEIFGGNIYTNHVLDYFYDPLAEGTYYNLYGDGTLCDTAGYVDWLRTERADQSKPNMAAWDIGMGLVGAAAVGLGGVAHAKRGHVHHVNPGDNLKDIIEIFAQDGDTILLTPGEEYEFRFPTNLPLHRNVSSDSGSYQ